MPSLLPGFGYDIFISYRQKDNKHDSWVTHFVENLKGELESTFKEDISIFFDENPHDRLQETHDVDKSLEDKLKCLIFIPILSQTYCDPRSYAWQYEFLSFLNAVRSDRFGKDVKLRGGNVASRILPIRIHDLEPEDMKLFEKETGSVLRPMDFVFKTASGVNRPLLPDDNKNDNLNKTIYRDQINKVAGAIKEIILSMKKPESAVQENIEKTIQDLHKSVDTEQSKPTGFTLRLRRLLIPVVSILLIIVGAIVVYSVLKQSKKSNDLSELDKSIAVLPFVDDSPAKDNDYLCNNMMEEILNQLQKISALRVKSRTSVEKYRTIKKDIKDIGNELDVSMIIEGSIRKVGDELRISAQLIDAKTGDHLWSEIYDGKYDVKIFDFQNNVARKVASSLNAFITPNEEKRIDIKPTSEMKAYDLCAKGGDMFTKWNHTRRDTGFLRAGINYYDQALKIDPLYAKAYTGKASLFREEGRYDSAIYYLNKASLIDPDSYDVLGGLATLYMFANIPDSSLKYCKKTVDLYPNEIWANVWMGQLTWFNMRSMDLTKAFVYYQNAYNLGGNSDPEINRHIGYIFSTIGEYQKAFSYFKNSISLSSDCHFVKEACLMLEYQGKIADCYTFLDSLYNLMPCNQTCDAIKFRIYTRLKEFVKAEEYYNKALLEGYIIYEEDDLYYAYLLKQTGRKKESLSILNKSINRDKDRLKTRNEVFNKVLINARLAASYALLEDKEISLRYLSDLNNLTLSGFYSSVTFNIFPGFDFLRNDSRFIEIGKQIDNEKDSIRKLVNEMELRGEINL